MISEDRKKHIFGVAEFLKDYATSQNFPQENIEALYTLGILHDIGYAFLEEKDYTMHEKVGGELLKKQGYQFWQEVYYHGVANCPYQSKLLDLLNWADMRIDSAGKQVSLDGRLEELSSRYNVPIKKLNSYPIVCELKSKGFN